MMQKQIRTTKEQCKIFLSGIGVARRIGLREYASLCKFDNSYWTLFRHSNPMPVIRKYVRGMN